jgi:hypothetical protein
MPDLKSYQMVSIRQKVHVALKAAGIKRGSGRSYRNEALRVVVSLDLPGAEYDFARGVVGEWLEGK